ncbi:Lysine-specific demethylase 3A [Camelus dromedarius]|uniref:Lysine-specific demethylase 3A n=1 Tax=Camelus dromedarius TaxID=9838 RepID=A0A5N4E6Z5_CAMDR|nr:Lysine-specific demethylase 3A [Camelus dromedarius]
MMPSRFDDLMANIPLLEYTANVRVCVGIPKGQSDQEILKIVQDGNSHEFTIKQFIGRKEKSGAPGKYMLVKR